MFSTVNSCFHDYDISSKKIDQWIKTESKETDLWPAWLYVVKEYNNAKVNE